MPFATCAHCRQTKTLDLFEQIHWEKVRANLPAMCLECRHSDGKGPKKRKLDAGTMKYLCSQCKVNKIEDAFPRAQLKQEEAKKCLSCCRSIKYLLCSACETNKPIDDFHSTMLTFPAAGVVCKACQEEARGQENNKYRKNMFTCRGCHQIFPGAAGVGQDRQRRCLNCSSRGTRQKDEQTCRNKGCKRTFHEKQVKGQPRKRFCPECRR
eukprot:Skav226891  [mRNA]  locus=scaffold1187:591614:592243:- [translate_table: standard]